MELEGLQQKLHEISFAMVLGMVLNPEIYYLEIFFSTTDPVKKQTNKPYS